MILKGKFNLVHTAGKFNILINENKEVFRKYFGVYLFPGSVNIKIEVPDNLQSNLDKGIPAFNFVIPREELAGMPPYIGNGQTWKCVLSCSKFSSPIDCWIFRRVGSRVPKGIIEIVSDKELVKPNGLQNGDDVIIKFSEFKEELHGA